MNAITTRYIGPTDTKGSRIKAIAGNGQTITIGYPYKFNGEDCHAQAALALCHKLGWDEYGRWGRFVGLVGAGTKDGYVFCFVEQPQSYSFHAFSESFRKALA